MDKLEQTYKLYKDKQPEWKYPICKLIFYRTYSRIKEDLERESWSDVIYRVVYNLYTFLSKTHDITEFDTTPEEMYELFWHMNCLCGGRSLFASTEKIIQRSSYALNNCSAYSINGYLSNPSMFFHRITDLLMQGCGVGFDCEPVTLIPIFQPKDKMCLHVVVDSREGWCDSIRRLFDSYFKLGSRTIEYDFLKIRAKNTPLKTFGGVASGFSTEDIEAYEQKVKDILKLTMNYSEPNFIIIDNIQKFGRLADPENHVDDSDFIMTNPCAEACLKNAELCNLSEIFLDRCSTEEQFRKCLRYSLFYCKVVSMMPTNNEETDSILRKNRRVGVSLSGIHEFVCRYGIERLKTFLDEGYKYLQNYDNYLSAKLNINRSVKLTVIAPSGTKSNLLGIFGSSINRPLYRYFIRRVRIQSSDPLLNQYQAMGYPIEIDQCSQNTSIILFPMKTPDYLKLHDGNIFYDLNMQVLLQRYWADQSVSCSVPIDHKLSLDELYEIIKMYSKQLKTMCFMTKIEKTYPQAPIECISEQTYNDMMSKIKEGDIGSVPPTTMLEAYYGCTNEHCSFMK